MHKNFPQIAQIIKDNLEPQGFHVDLHSDRNEIVCTDVVGRTEMDIPTADATFVVWVGTR